MKTTRLFLYSLLIGFLFITACSKDDENKVNESQVLTEYLESASSPLGKDFVNSDMPTIISASDVQTLNATGQVYIIDIRAEADFKAGHIKNAHNVAAGNILTHIQGVDLTSYTKVAIVCYTGQTAGWAACILQLMGYNKVYSMKWGMSSWNADFNKWGPNVGNTYATQFSTTSASKDPAGNLPTLSTGKSTGQEILEARVNAVLTEGFDNAKITSSTVFGSLDSYYIINYWPENHYSSPGHIPGAIQYTPKGSIKLSADLKTIPTGKIVVVYCYTGQTSAYLTAYLRILGYDAKSLLFGTNGMIYDMMSADGLPVFSDTQIMGYDYETEN